MNRLAGMLRTGLLFLLNGTLRPLGYEVVIRRQLVDLYLHEYESYEQYRQVQTHHNKRKIDRVWADEATLTILCDELRREIPDRTHLTGICHGTRSGFEQRFIAAHAGHNVIGTEISDTADQFPSTVQWDFHDVNEEWLSKFDFVYSNSLDHAWNPKLALETWLNQLNATGVLALEYADAHSPVHASEIDPFGVRPTVVPYVLCEWFGHDVSVRCVKCRKSNYDNDVWLFLIRKNGDTVAARNGHP